MLIGKGEASKKSRWQEKCFKSNAIDVFGLVQKKVEE